MKRFIIQDLSNLLYFYGHYSNKQWTDKISEAKFFDDREELEERIKNNIDNLEGKFITIIEVFL